MPERNAGDAPANPHLVNGEFQSDKYPTCPPGKVPLSTHDPMAQDLLWEYAKRRHQVDAIFTEAVESDLQRKGFDPSTEELFMRLVCAVHTVSALTFDERVQLISAIRDVFDPSMQKWSRHE